MGIIKISLSRRGSVYSGASRDDINLIKIGPVYAVKISL